MEISQKKYILEQMDDRPNVVFQRENITQMNFFSRQKKIAQMRFFKRKISPQMNFWQDQLSLRLSFAREMIAQNGTRQKT